MFENYFKTAVRNLWKNKGFSSINIGGLAIGLATCLLIILYVLDELSFDRHHANANRIYRVNNEVKFGSNYFDIAQCAALMGPTIVKDFPQVEQYTRLEWHGSILVKKENENLREGKIAFADSTLFEVFTLPMVYGDPKTALKEPHSVVITESIAKKYFNRTDVAGRYLVINNTSNYMITGVIKDLPRQSHFDFDFFIAMAESEESRNEQGWLSQTYNTYILLREGADPEKLVPEIDKMMNRHIGPLLKSALNISMDEFQKEGNYVRSGLTPLTQIHLLSNKSGELAANGSIVYVYIFSAIAFFILLIACVNFMNLSTASSANRAKEVGVRKVLGSLRKNLVAQFLTESLLVSFLALFIAVITAFILLPYFNQLTGKDINISLLFQPRLVMFALSLMLVVGLLAGSYPAIFLSAFQPIEVLKGKLSRGFRGSWLRSVLVIFQFAVSIALIAGTVIIYNQLMYIRSKDIGFNREQVLTIHNTESLKAQAESFKRELLQFSGVENATLTGYLPINGYRSNDAFFTSPTLDQKTAISMQKWIVDESYIPTFNIKLVKGRNLSSDFPSDSNAVIINEAAAKFMGTKDLINKQLYLVADIQSGKIDAFNIIGVVKNFNFSSLRDHVSPLALFLGKEPGSIAVRIRTADLSGLLTQIKNKWQAMSTGEPFTYSFMDEEFDNLYRTDQKTGKILITFTVLAILIACLGLFGLATYAAEQRRKEIGIRKVLGATVGNITGMLSKDFLMLVLIAALIAFPVSWWAMNKWLQDFAYRINIGWWVFALAGFLALVIALVTVSFQAIKAAIANPVRSLRTE